MEEEEDFEGFDDKYVHDLRMQTFGEYLKDLVEPDALSSIDKEYFRETCDKFILSNFGNLFRRGDEKRFRRRGIITAENKLLVLQAMHDNLYIAA
ncbi:hypothetical protein V1505DRAFT_358962 [Lipomyces doorenjongii]